MGDAVGEQAALEALDVLGRLVADLGSAEWEVALEQGRREQLLMKLKALLFPVALGQLLRGAEAAAEALAAFTPTLPASDDGPAALAAMLQQLSAGCTASALLLNALVDIQDQGTISPAAAYRLAGCAGLALGPGCAALQAAQRRVAGAPTATQEHLASQLEAACNQLLSVGWSAQLVVSILGERQPGPALRATTCKRDRLLALCLACAPMLKWLHEWLGPQDAILDKLVELAADLAPFQQGELVGDGGAALLDLLSMRYTALARRVCSLGPAQLSARSGEAAVLSWLWLGVAMCHLPSHTPLPPVLDTLTANTAAVVAHLLPALSSCALWQLRLMDATADLAKLNLAALRQHAESATAGPTPRRSSPGPAALPLSEACLEGLAVNASALSALAEVHARGLAGASAEAAARVSARLSMSCDRLSAVLQHVSEVHWQTVEQHCGAGSQGSSSAPPGSFPAAAAATAAEAALRLCGRLLQLWPQLSAAAGEQGATLAGAVVCVWTDASGAALTLAQGAAVDMKAATLTTRPTVDARTAAAFGRLAGTAAKLGLLLASQTELPPCLEGALPPLIGAMRALALTTAPHAVPGAAACGGVALSNASQLVWVLVECEKQLPWLAVLQRQELARLVCGEWTATWELWGGSKEKLTVAQMTSAVEFFKNSVEYFRSAACMVRMGFVDTAISGAQQLLAGGRAQDTQVALAVQQLWALVESLGAAVLAQAGDPADPAAASTWRQGCAAVRQLPPGRQRQRLCSRGFWEQEVAGALLPALKRLAAAVGVPIASGQRPEDAEALLRAARAHAARPCAHPGCTNLRGASEGRLRGRRCAGCGDVRYCSPECARADWPQHGRVCGALRQEAAARCRRSSVAVA